MSRRYRSRKSLITFDLLNFLLDLASRSVAWLLKKVFKLLYLLLDKYLFFGAANVVAVVVTEICLDSQFQYLIFTSLLLCFCYSLIWVILHCHDIWDEDDLREGACKIAPLCGSASCLFLIFYHAFSVS